MIPYYIRLSKSETMNTLNQFLILFIVLILFSDVSAQEMEMRKGIMIPVNNAIVEAQLRALSLIHI